MQAAMLSRGIGLGLISGITHSLRIGELLPASRHIVSTGAAYHLMSSQRSTREEVYRVQAWFCEQMRGDLEEVKNRFWILQPILET
ncbi:hypothetical protein [Chitinasiproducens palmae]|uniref:hypothetical protein n=1 Tax=Chitinasiproducens palmae TaxID=1770053 RepID=UPI000B8553DB|nr:hypothetical protein [Chitinasiproducens palmae]